MIGQLQVLFGNLSETLGSGQHGHVVVAITDLTLPGRNHHLDVVAEPEEGGIDQLAVAEHPLVLANVDV